MRPSGFAIALGNDAGSFIEGIEERVGIAGLLRRSLRATSPFSSGLGCRIGRNEKFGNGDAERVGQPLDDGDSGIAAGALEPRDRWTRHTGSMREFLLRKTHLAPPKDKIEAKGLKGRRATALDAPLRHWGAPARLAPAVCV